MQSVAYSLIGRMDIPFRNALSRQTRDVTPNREAASSDPATPNPRSKTAQRHSIRCGLRVVESNLALISSSKPSSTGNLDSGYANTVIKPALRRLIGFTFWFWLTLAGCLIGALPANADDKVEEYKLKAAFLYHISQFVDWPENSTSSFRICVLGGNPFGESLAALENRKRAEQTIVIAFPQSLADAKACQIVYLKPDQDEDLERWLIQLRGMPVLTVGSQSGFIERGGVIGFLVEEGRVRLEINNEAALRSQLKISAKLQQVAKRVLQQAVTEVR